MQPGDIIIGKFGSHKARPWVVIWVEEEAALLCACSRQGNFPGVLPIYHKCFEPNGISFATPWVMVLALGGLKRPPHTVGKLRPEDTFEIEAHLASYFDLRK